MRVDRVFASVALALASALAAACAPPTPRAEVPAPLEHIAEVHKAKCGNCHVRVEPGTRTKGQLESAFTRHRSRVHLAADEWPQMIEYLSRSPQLSAAQGGGRS